MLKGYTTKEKIEKYLLIDIDNTFNDQVDEWIETAERIIDTETGRDFSPVAETPVFAERLYNGNATSTLRIDPATEIESIKLSPTGDEVDTDQYVTYPTLGGYKDKVQLRYLKFPQGIQNIAVSAKWGYDAVPKDIEFAATVIVAGIINESWDSGGEIQSMTIGRYSVTYRSGTKTATDMASIQDILDKNRRYAF